MSIGLPNSSIIYEDNFLTNNESTNLFNFLNEYENWKQYKFKLYGNDCKQNRLTCAFSLNGVKYKYNKINTFTDDMNQYELLINLKNKIETKFNNKYNFNYILLNKYENGNHNLGMHSDDEEGLYGPIVSISLGCSRFFDIKHKFNNSIKKRLELNNGSILIMDGDTQDFYKHGIPIQKKIKNCRINLTFRIIKQD